MRLSISKIKAYKACKRMYQLRYLEGVEPICQSEALVLGSNYHELLEFLNKNGTLDGCEEDNSKELAMACAYQKHIYPKFHVESAEKWLVKDLGGGDTLVGIADGIADDGCIVEYKTYGGNESMEQYEYNLQWDEQILAYMYMTGLRKVHYVICRKPTIRQRQSESPEEFFNRMIAWYDEDTDERIKLIEITRTDDDIDQFEVELYQMLLEMKNSNNFYRNTCNCYAWGRRCEYSSICLNYDPNQEYLEFTKGEKQYEPTQD